MGTRRAPDSATTFLTGLLLGFMLGGTVVTVILTHL